MATCDNVTVEATISATVSDNDDDPHTTMTLPKSDDGAQCRAPGESTTTTTTTTMMISSQGVQEETHKNQEESSTPHAEKKRSLSFMRMPKLKREKSYSETLERKKKRVKFSPHDGDDGVIVSTRVFEPQDVDSRPREDAPAENNLVSATIKKLMRKSSKKRKASIETQTEDKKDEDKENEKNNSRAPEGTCIQEVEDVNPSSPDTQSQQEGDVTLSAEVSNLTDSTITSAGGDTPVSPAARVSDELACLRQPSSRLMTPDSSDGASCDVRAEAGVPAVPRPAVINEEDITHSGDERRIYTSEEQLDTAIPENSNMNNYRLKINNTHLNYQKLLSEYEYDLGVPRQVAPLSEEQELEISEFSKADDSLDNSSSSCEELLVVTSSDKCSATSSQVTVKREGTFTLDGPPPPKITKPSCDAAGADTTPCSRRPSRDSLVEPLQFFVDLTTPELSSPKNSRKLTRRLEQNTCKDASSLAAKLSPKMIKQTRAIDRGKKVQDQNSTITTLKNNAKRTFVNAWRTATKTQEVPRKSLNPTMKSPRETSTPRDSPTQQEKPTNANNTKIDTKTAKSVSWEKHPTPKETRSPARRSRDPTKVLPWQEPKRSPVWGGVSLPTFRREGTFTKKYDSEMERLQAECNRLNVEKERLQSEVCEARARLEEETMARKALRRTHDLNLRHLREGELRRTELRLLDLKNRLEDERRQALAQQKDALTRTHEADMMRTVRERDEDHRRQLHEARLTQERLKAEIRREASRCEPTPVPWCHATDRDLDRLNRDLSTLREHKKRLEEAVLTLQESERQRASELRRLHEEHEAAVAKIHRANKSEGARLLDELRARERTIGLLERQVSAQASKLRQHEDKTRGGGSGATGKKHKEVASCKDVRPREKEPCVSQANTNSSNQQQQQQQQQQQKQQLPHQSGTAREENVEEDKRTTTPRPDHVIQPPSPPPAAMAEEVEQLRAHVEQQRSQMEDQVQQLERQKQEWEQQLQQFELQKQEWKDQVHQFELQKQELEEQLQQFELQKQEWVDERQELLKQLDQQQELFDNERQRLEQQVEESLLQVEEQRQVMEAQKLVMEEQKQVMEEQELRIVDLTEEVMEQECMAHPPPTTWPLRRESCVKVSELPTVMEQNSDEESSPTSTPTTTPHNNAPNQFPAFTLEEPPATPTTFLTPTTPGTEPPVWPQVTEMSNHYAQLSKEHQELQKSYQLLASTSAATSPVTNFPGKDGAAAWWLSARVLELEALAATLRVELQETKDHADLLEFRCLELTEGSERGSEVDVPPVETCDQSTATELDDVSLAVTNEDLSLPLSIDSGLDISNDYKTRVTEGRAWLAELCQAVGEQECSAAHHLAALLDWVATLPTHTHHACNSPMSPTLATPKTRMGVEELGCDLGRDLTVLAARLQESLADPAAQESVLLDTITKLRLLDTTLCQLQERVVHLTEENRELQEAVASLGEAHETRTEASGTESELVHRKTPSIHSDLSDAESDSPEHVQEHRAVKMVNALDAATSFQESGIFDTSCELVHVTTQTDLESDEYLRAALDEERVSLSKLEYDSILEGERCLQGEIEHLKCEKDQLMLECDSIKDQMRKYRSGRGTDAEETLKGEIRVLKQRLAVSERARQEVFDEKCELEEEENDSRLMVQRLESQMEAAREMENLLSASLSQEQEISRELHRRVRDLQILEKDHRGRLEKLESASRRAEEKAATLSKARDDLAMQLNFAAYGLIIANYWRQTVPQSTAALVQYSSSKTLNVLPERCRTKTLTEGTLDTFEIYPRKSSNGVPVSPRVVCDVCIQTCLEPPTANAGNQCYFEFPKESTAKYEIPSHEHGQRRAAERNDDEPANKRPRNISTKSQATMTLKAESLTEREQFYLEQIESLQREKINLRKGQDNERRDSIQQHCDLEGEINEIRFELEEATRDKCKLLFRLEETQDEKEEIRRNLLVRIEELKGDMSRYNELHELEKKALRKEYDAQLQEVEKEGKQREERVQQLELQLSTFRQELEMVGISIANDLDMDSDMENVHSCGRKSPMKCSEADGDVLKKIRELVKSETDLRQKIYDLEKKECAYRETIHEADKIMSSHVTSYKQRIEELEAAADQQTLKIQQLEVSEERLRTTLRNNARTSEGARISDLLDRLIEIENSELKLKERVWNLERSEKELQIKLMEAEKANQALRGELRDQEEIVHRLMSLETENNALSLELNQAQDSARKVSEIQQNESYLRARVEELEVTENMLRETLQQADVILAQRERKLRDQVESLQEEVQAYRAQLEAAASKEYGAKESEVSYKKQLEQLRNRLADTERELKESSSETISHETQHRSEVTKLRNQLKLCNSQLMELDRLNCELRDRIVAAEAEGERLAKQLEESSRRHEHDLLALNLQVSSRDSHMEELEHQLDQLSHEHAASELDALAASPIAALHSSITTLTTALKNCETCNATQSGTLTEVTNQLGTLVELVEGQPNNPNMADITSDADDEDVSDSYDTDTAENLANEATTTPPPNPAGEGIREQLSGEIVHCITGGKFQRNTLRRSRRRLEERNSRRLMRTQSSSTILEELEEKVREMEEVVGRKEEELRLADIEACELNSQLQSRDVILTQKCEDVEHLNATLASLRQQLVHTMEDAERTRLSLQAKHKVDLEELTRRVEQLTEKVEHLARRGQLKDSIISTLALQIRAILRSGNMGVVINQLRRLSEVGPSDQSAGKSDTDPEHMAAASPLPAVPDFDVNALCSFLSQPSEMASLSQCAILNGMEPSCPVTLESDISLAPSHNGLGPSCHVTFQGSPSLAHRRKSRIPRFLPSTVHSIKSATAPKPMAKAKAAPKSMQSDKLSMISVQMAKSVSHPKTLAKIMPVNEQMVVERASEPMETVKSAPVRRHEVKPVPSYATCTIKPVATSTPAKPTGTKDSTRRERPIRSLSDARKIKRMVTGTTPLDAAVDCASAPEWRERSPLGSTCSDIEATCVPRPQELHITRRVGVDGVVIAWAPLDHDCVAGFQVLVGGRVVQHVRSPHRTKALVTGLPLAGCFTIGLVTVSTDGRCSSPVIVTQDRSRVYPGRSSGGVPRHLRRNLPTCL
nr:protein lava lamp-like isoform X3 [Procambarus clarkii]